MPQALAVILRAFILYILVFAAVRLTGKRQPAKTTAFGFVNYVVIAVITSVVVLGIVPEIVLGILALAVWVLMPVLVDILSTRSKAFHDLFFGRETILIKQGKIMDDNLKQARLTAEELLADLRAKNTFNLADVEFAVLENTGELSVLLKSDKKPVTPHDMEWMVSPQTEPQTVILDGNILNEPLTEMGLNHNWLHVQLETMGISLDNVFVGQVDSAGELYVDLFDDSLQLPQARVREMLFAALEKAQAELSKYGLETEDQGAKTMYAQNAEKLGALSEKLKPYLLR